MKLDDNESEEQKSEEHKSTKTGKSKNKPLLSQRNNDQGVFEQVRLTSEQKRSFDNLGSSGSQKQKSMSTKELLQQLASSQEVVLANLNQPGSKEQAELALNGMINLKD